MYVCVYYLNMNISDNIHITYNIYMCICMYDYVYI